MIFDGQRNFAFYSQENYIIPAEALLVSIEVKSLMNATEIERSLKSAKRLGELKPFRREVVFQRERGEDTEDKCRYFNCIFAYNTDLSEDDWLNKEYTRLFTLSERLDIPLSVINRIYVANRGLLHPDEEKGITEEPHSGVALMHFYMHILNFLIREDKRREPTPYLDYAGRLIAGWTELELISRAHSE